MEKISVIIPLFNKSEFIIPTLQSAIEQSFPADEIIVVDDGSTDDGPSLIASNFGAVRVVTQVNQGEGQARNRGLIEARNEWCAFLDADDLWLPDHLAEIALLIRDFPDCDLVGSRYQVVMQSTPTRRRAKTRKPRRINYLREAASSRGTFSSSTTAVRKGSLLSIGGFGSERVGTDTKAWLSMALRGPCALGGKVTCFYMAGRGVMKEVGEEQAIERKLGTSRPRKSSLIPVDLSEVSPALGLAERHLAQTADPVLRRDLVTYINGRLFQSVKGAVRFGDDPRPFALALKRPLGARGRMAQLLAHLPRQVHLTGVELFLVTRQGIWKFLSILRQG